MNKFLSISLMALLFTACQNSSDRTAVDPEPTSTDTFNTSSIPTIDSNGQGTITANLSVPVPLNTTSSTGTAILNPSHGSPGHRCDIAVGAPLNGTVSNTPAGATNSNPAPVMLQPKFPVQAINKNVRLNPAHGAPGHDCAIAVGQPLKN